MVRKTPFYSNVKLSPAQWDYYIVSVDEFDWGSTPDWLACHDNISIFSNRNVSVFLLLILRTDH